MVTLLGFAIGEHGFQARIQGVGAGARAHPRDEVSPFKMHYSIAFKRQSITGRPPLGEILYPPLASKNLHFLEFIVVTAFPKKKKHLK